MLRTIHPNRYFLWAIAIFLIVILGLLWFVISAFQEIDGLHSDFTIGLPKRKTYVSADLGFLIRYPGHWQVELDRQNNNSVSFQNPRNFYENINVTVTSDPKLEKVIRFSLTSFSERSFFIGGLKGQWLKVGNQNDPATNNVILVHRADRLYLIVGSAREFENIIRSFKFVEILN